MIFDDVSPKLPIMNEYFCRGKQKNCNIFFLNQNMFFTNRQSVRENCNLFIIRREVRYLKSISPLIQ